MFSFYILTCALFFISTINLYMNNEAEISKKEEQIKNNLFLKKNYLQKNDLNTNKVIFSDIIGCLIGLYNMLIKIVNRTFFIPNTAN